MSWIKIQMKFPNKCLVCGKTVGVGQTGYWSRGVGIKHEACADQEDGSKPKSSKPEDSRKPESNNRQKIQNSIQCIVCGDPAGCSLCEMLNDCSTEAVSKNCICKKCLSDSNAFTVYQKAAESKFPILGQRFGTLNS